MISTFGASAGRCAHRARGAEDRPRLHLVDLGMQQPEPHAARAEHRVALLERAHALELRARARRARASPRSARLGEVLDELGAVGQELVQRRVEQPDRDRQALHRLEQPLEVAPAAAAAARRARRAGPPRRRPGSSRCIFGWRSAAMNMCSVRQRPMPSAPNSRARRASSGVSALARTPSVRSSSHQPSTRLEVRRRRAAATSGTSSSVTAPVLPSIAIRSPSCRTRSPMRITPACRSMSTAAAPVTAGRPMPRATSAACEALPPSEVRMPLAAWKPATSSASVNGRTRMTSRPLRGGRDGVLAR